MVIYSSFPDAADNAYAMFLHLRGASADLKHAWIVGAGFASGSKDLAGATLLPRDSLRALYAMARAEWVFHTHGIYRFARRRRGQTIVNLWHGMPLKAIGTYDPDVSRLPLGDVAIATSPMFQEIMARAFRMPRERVILCGQPRNDLTVRAAARSEPDIALWMPTYRLSIQGEIRRDSPLAPEAMMALLSEVEAHLEPGAAVVLKLHPMDALNSILDGRIGRIRVLRSMDSQEAVEELMARSRCLVSDYSSAAIDYITLGRPLGFFCPDRAKYTRGFIEGVEQPYFAAGTMLENARSLARFLSCPVPGGDLGSSLVTDRDDRAAERLWTHLKSVNPQ
ncbi:MAG: CDP-glycerol glycerophosphotransferase family protein [Novosphingobium sp.]|nr:CDP-glycerol glycerophosphotransferase family protein [Novosphingobium sp.]